MSATERVVQSILYELGCVLIGCLVMQFVPHEGPVSYTHLTLPTN